VWAVGENEIKRVREEVEGGGCVGSGQSADRVC